MTCVLDTSDGAALGSAGHEYAHAAMERTLASSGAPVPPHWALQDLADCIKALQKAVPAAVRAVGIRRQGRTQGVQDGRDGEGNWALEGPPTFFFQYRPGAVSLATLVSPGEERHGQARPDSGQFAVA